jgi:hypothetical protein
MGLQIFKKQIPKEILYDLLNKICIKNENYYIFNKISYKKAEYQQLLEPFCQSLVESYHISKQTYVTRKQTYNSFLTIIRQLCRLNDINYASNVVYIKSTYEIIYHIYDN